MKRQKKGKRKARTMVERTARERAAAGKEKGSWWNEQQDQWWTEPFRGNCGYCWKWGHKKAQCRHWQGRRPMELGAMVTHPSQSVVSDPGSSVSQRVQAVNSSPVSPVFWSAASVDFEEDWHAEWWHDWESDWMDDWQDDWYWHSSGDCASEWYDEEGTYLVCGVACSSPSLNQQSNNKVKLMIDSGSQSTACSVDFAKGFATDDTERAKVWDIQDQKIEAQGKKIVDVKFHGQAIETPVPASIKVDVSDVARNVASMGRLLRARFDFNFTNPSHTCWMENGGSSLQFGCRSAASAERNLSKTSQLQV